MNHTIWFINSELWYLHGFSNSTHLESRIGHGTFWWISFQFWRLIEVENSWLMTSSQWRHISSKVNSRKIKQVQLIKHLKVKLMSCILDEKVWVWGLIWPPWRKSMILYPRFIHRFISLLKYDFHPYDNPVGLFVWKWPSIGRPWIRPAKLFADLLLS